MHRLIRSGVVSRTHIRQRIRRGPIHVRPCDPEDPKEQARIQERMALYDSLEEPVALLVQEFGLRAGLEAARLHYGRWEQARAYCLSRQKRI